jgi:hypothetical protein
LALAELVRVLSRATRTAEYHVAISCSRLINPSPLPHPHLIELMTAELALCDPALPRSTRNFPISHRPKAVICFKLPTARTLPPPGP